MLRVRRMGSCPCKQPGHPIARFHSNPSGKWLAARSAVLHRLSIARAIDRALRLASHLGKTLVQLQKDFEQVLTPKGMAGVPTRAGPGSMGYGCGLAPGNSTIKSIAASAYAASAIAVFIHIPTPTRGARASLSRPSTGALVRILLRSHAHGGIDGAIAVVAALALHHFKEEAIGKGFGVGVQKAPAAG